MDAFTFLAEITVINICQFQNQFNYQIIRENTENRKLLGKFHFFFHFSFEHC